MATKKRIFPAFAPCTANWSPSQATRFMTHRPRRATLFIVGDASKPVNATTGVPRPDHGIAAPADRSSANGAPHRSAAGACHAHSGANRITLYEASYDLSAADFV